jgi:hypothetical protein
MIASTSPLATARIYVFVLAASLVSGCQSANDRQPLSGEITLDGVPLDSGSIRFSSLPGQKAVSSGAMIKAGNFDVPQEKGLPPGRYRVEISSPDAAAAPVMMRAEAGEPAFPVAPERIPAEYNVNSQQTIEVTAGSDNQFDFAIVAKKH